MYSLEEIEGRLWGQGWGLGGGGGWLCRSFALFASMLPSMLRFIHSSPSLLRSFVPSFIRSLVSSNSDTDRWHRTKDEATTTTTRPKDQSTDDKRHTYRRRYTIKDARKRLKRSKGVMDHRTRTLLSVWAGPPVSCLTQPPASKWDTGHRATKYRSGFGPWRNCECDATRY